jgi:hypothetical protein
MKSIVIYNPVSGHGHLDSWNAIFTKVLLESGWRVLSISSDPEGLFITLKGNNCLNLKNLKAIPASRDNTYTNSSSNSEKFLLKGLWKKINSTGYAYVFGDGTLVAKKPAKFHEKLLAASYLFLHFFRYFLFPLVKVSLKAQDINEVSTPFVLSDIEREIEGQKFEANVVFHMYLDDLDFYDPQLSDALSTLKFKWAGIRFAPELEDHAILGGHPKLKGIAFLDKEIANSMAKSLPNMHVRYLPDIANLEVLEEMPDVIQLIKHNAKGRIIIFLGGIIGLRKNLNLWLELIDTVDPKKWYFVQIGEIDFKNLNAKEFFGVYKKLLLPPENFMLIPAYISDEGIFNSIISTSDIVFAVYKDFKNSSNMITKASFFHKPILVSDRYLMGRRVQAFGIGIAVRENDIQMIISGLERLASANIPLANFDIYNHTFNQEVFGDEFLKFMDDLNES